MKTIKLPKELQTTDKKKILTERLTGETTYVCDASTIRGSTITFRSINGQTYYTIG